MDLAKGFLVTGMVIFHAINYFGYGYDAWLIYLKFVSGGFILVSGYIIAAIYGNRWIHEPRLVTGRLLGRGLKLVVLFTVLNVAVSLASIRNFNSVQFGLTQFLQHLPDIYGVGSGKHAVFEILLPIGYLLLLSPALLWSRRYPFSAVLLTLCVCATAAFSPGWRLDNPNLLLVGVAGLAAGMFVPPERLAARPHLALSLPLLVAGIIAVPWLRGSLLGYLGYTLVVLKAVMDLGAATPANSVLKRVLRLFGEHVLFCYLAHIVLLQSIFRIAWPQRDSDLLTVALIVLATWAILVVAAWIVTVARRAFPAAQRAYALVFA